MAIRLLRHFPLGLVVATVLLVPSLGGLPSTTLPILKTPVPLVKLEPVAGGFVTPLLVTHAGDGSGRIFVVEQVGRVWSIQGGVRSLYLDVSAKVNCCGERGLLGLAFHPEFEDNGKLFITYSRAADGANVLEKLVVADPPNGNPPPNGEILLVIPQPFSNHNAGMLAFGPDGYLYWSKGDGGAGGDPFNFAQNPQSLLGKILRLDVDVANGYANPPTNPYAVLGGGRGEIWALGLRNPWRFSFDRATGDLWIGDVGQNAWEEVDKQPVPLAPMVNGWNYGWSWWEGNHAFKAGGPTVGMTWPVMEYSHGLGCSVTGGYVYRGLKSPTLSGTYFFADFCSGRIWGGVGAGLAYEQVELLDTNLLVSSFGEDESGEVYVVHYGGSVHRLAAA